MTNLPSLLVQNYHVESEIQEFQRKPTEIESLAVHTWEPKAEA